MINAIFSDLVNIKRRQSYTAASRDAWNNPIYGDPTTWALIYIGVKIRLAWSGKMIRNAMTGELVYPQGNGYAPKNLILLPQDRIITLSNPGNMIGIEYVIEAIYPAYLLNNVIDHWEFSVHLPL